MTEVRNDIFKEGELVGHFRAIGLKVSKRIISLDKLLPELTPEELEKLGRDMASTGLPMTTLTRRRGVSF